MTYKKIVSCQKNNLKVIRDFVAEVLNKYNISERESNLIIVAIDEVCSNLMIHTHKCNPEKNIDILIMREKGNLCFEIHNSERIFDIINYSEPKLEKLIKEKRNGGFGLILVKKIMDNIQIENRNGINICRLSKQLGSPIGV
jgi:serine/threonine-protein kinase RsbW